MRKSRALLPSLCRRVPVPAPARLSSLLSYREAMVLQSTLTIPREARYWGNERASVSQEKNEGKGEYVVRCAIWVPSSLFLSAPRSLTHLQEDKGTAEQEAESTKTLSDKDPGAYTRHRAKGQAAKVESTFYGGQLLGGSVARQLCRARSLDARGVHLGVGPSCSVCGACGGGIATNRSLVSPAKGRGGSE